MFKCLNYLRRTEVFTGFNDNVIKQISLLTKIIGNGIILRYYEFSPIILIGEL